MNEIVSLPQLISMEKAFHQSHIAAAAGEWEIAVHCTARRIFPIFLFIIHVFPFN
jgi:hypothetical protein